MKEDKLYKKIKEKYKRYQKECIREMIKFLDECYKREKNNERV